MSEIEKINQRLSKSFEELADAEESIHTRRNVWEQETKTLITSTFNQIKGVYDSYLLEATTHTETKNGNTIILFIKNRTSGLVFTDPMSDKIETYVKSGGELYFQQIFNGKILIRITLPKIDKWTGQQQDITVGLFEPKTINKEFILEQIATFIEEITKWENQ